jgi:hypothetical protein
MKDFSRDRELINFTIDGDKFDCVPAIPAKTLMEMTSDFAGMDDDDPTQAIKAMMTVLEKFLLPASFALFERRMGDQARPIEFPQVNDVIMWLMEQYGMRPTEQSEPSAAGLPLPEPGTTSTGSTPDVVSISLPSPQTSS